MALEKAFAGVRRVAAEVAELRELFEGLAERVAALENEGGRCPGRRSWSGSLKKDLASGQDDVTERSRCRPGRGE